MPQSVRELIAELSAIENQDQPIIYALWLAKDIEYGNGLQPTPEQFSKAIEELVGYDLFTEPTETIVDVVYEVMRESMCSNCDEPISSLERAGNDGVCDSCQQLEESE
jgi:hypothetical protein